MTNRPSDDDLRAIAAGPAPAPDSPEDAMQRLRSLAESLHKNNYSWAAKAIARYVLGEAASLDKAFGLVAKQGRPAGSTLERDVAVLQALRHDQPVNSISKQFGMDRKDIRGLRDIAEGFFDRYLAACAEINDTDAILSAILNRGLSESESGEKQN